MNRTPPLLAALVLALALAVPSQEIWAGGRHEGRQGRETPQRGHQQDMSPARAAELARRRTGGRVLAVKPGKKGYRVKVLTPKGEVRYVPIGKGGR